MPVRIDEIESDIELEGEGREMPAQGQAGAAPAPSITAIEQRARDVERTRAWDFDD